MIRLYDTGAYLVHGTDIIADDREMCIRDSTEAGKRRLVLQFAVEEVFTATEK